MRIPLVNEEDEIIGHKLAAERTSDDLYRVTGLWVTNEKGEILLAQRSFNRRTSAGCWGAPVAGTVEEGETYESNIIKEAEEELGISAMTFVSEVKSRRVSNHVYPHQYFMQWYSVVVARDYPFVLDRKEMERVEWFSPEKVLSWYKEKPEEFITNFDQTIEYFLGQKK